MGRRPTYPGSIPRLRIRRNASGSLRYYYDSGFVDGVRHLTPLGTDRVAALRRWAELEGHRAPQQAAAYTVTDVVTRYRASGMAHLARETQRSYDRHLVRIVAVFGQMDVETVTPAQVWQWYQATIAKRGLTTANRAKACLGALLAWANKNNLLVRSNPAHGLTGRKSRGRKSVLITDDLFARVYASADPITRRAMRLADLTGLRPADLLSLTRSHIVHGCLVLRTAKTDAPWAMLIQDDLRALVDELLAHRGSRIDLAPELLRDETGEPVTATQLQQRFKRARTRAGVETAAFQFRDIRARAGTRVALREGIEAARLLLAHTTQGMTQQYVRASNPVRPA